MPLEVQDNKLNESSNDLTQLSTLSCQNICNSLRSRYNCNQIYTWCGPNTLVAVNPGKRLVEKLYSIDELNSCLAIAHSQSLQSSQKPHIYSLAAAAYHNLLISCGSGDSSYKSQTLIVSGVSGAGKTESSKHLLRFLSHASCSSVSTQSTQSGIEDTVEATNPLLECFGNARTDENDNSSRFGRHLELMFDSRGRLLGGRISILLLERGRCLRPWPTKSAAAAAAAVATRDLPFHSLLCLVDAECISDLNDSRLAQRLLDKVSHQHSQLGKYRWRDLAPLLDRFLESSTSSSSSTEQAATDPTRCEVARLLAGILLLARLQISSSTEAKEDENAPAVFPPEAVADAEAAVCSGFGLPDAEQLLAGLAGARIQSGRGSVFMRACTRRECAGRRDALCRLIYDRLFAYLVRRINQRIEPPASAAAAAASIGILDLYGFENFHGRNGLDQLLINYANERLQQFYLTHFVLAAKQEYANERLPWQGEVDDDLQCLGATGVNSLSELSIVTEAISQSERALTALEELCRLNRPDRQLADRLGCGPSNSQFIVRHFSASVSYQVAQLPAENRDRCPKELVSLLSDCSQSALIRRIFQPDDGQIDDRSVKSIGGVASKFRHDLARLLDRLRHSRPLWVRCLRPSLASLSTDCRWSDDDVVNQLESCGLLPATRAARQQHPVRLVYADFLRRYGCLIMTRSDPGYSPSPAEFDLAYRRQNDLPTTPSRTPERLLRRRTGASPVDHQRRLVAGVLIGQPGVPPVKFGRQFGRSKLFLTAEQAEALDKRLAQHRLDSAVRLQRAVRSWLNRRSRRLTVARHRELAEVSLNCETDQSAATSTRPASVDQQPIELRCVKTGFVSRHQLGRQFRRLSDASRKQLFRGPTRAERLLPYARQRGLAASRGLEDALEDDLE